jgi:hypothetical protein
MVLNKRTIAIWASVSFLINFIVHAYVVYTSLTVIPRNLLVALACLPFFPIWVIVIFGIMKLRKWGFQIGLLISVVGVVFSFAGILLLSVNEAYITLLIDLIQICFCVYALRSLRF